MVSLVVSVRVNNSFHHLCACVARTLTTSAMPSPKDEAKELIVNYLDGKDNGIAVLGLNRPAARNSFGKVLISQLNEALASIRQNNKLRVLIVRSLVPKVFCAGADLKDRPNTEIVGDFLEHNRITRETSNAITECAKPVIAAVNGAALGAGMGLMAACDIMYASENAVFGMPEINVGLAGGAAMLHSLFGRSTMRRMFFTGQRLTARELLARNVIEDVLPPDQLLPAAMALAQDIAAKMPQALLYAKRAANMVTLMPQRDAYRFEQDFTMALSKTEDAREARQAFLEKRAPKFTGR